MMISPNSKRVFLTIFISLLSLISLLTTQTRPSSALHVAAAKRADRRPVGLHRSKKRARLVWHEKRANKGFDYNRRFSAMLPKGYVPPSDSSPCHNLYPNSVAFFCHLSSPKVRGP
ncbi:Unknown protein [Striga hermonthica]|uniref:Uncharacterized protein n=1 Tax=Striga hermonthica TaxID=68872 RepID=A0A9N7N7N5_STRHE|nr:Unknown protein [Striga hermonthica]